jgi:nitrate reductase delta subunit
VRRRLSDLRHPGRSGADREVIWQAASVLLSYPDDPMLGRLPLVRAAASSLPRRDRQVVLALVDDLAALEPMAAQTRYVETFDHKRRRTLYLTYWVAGDTRNRGQAILNVAQTYRASGAMPPSDELADHLTVVLEFAATVDPDAGYALLAGHVTPLSMLESALREAGSVYADLVGLVVSTLPAPGPDDLARARRLTMAGPPVEAVGLDPYPTPLPHGVARPAPGPVPLTLEPTGGLR